MRRSVMLCLLTLVLLFAGSLAAQQNPPPRAKAFATAADIPYESAPNFLKLPVGRYLGEGIGVARNSRGNIFVYTRNGETSELFEFDPTGKFLREIGEGLYGFSQAHGVRVDREDNIWAVDEGTDMVIKFNPAGRVMMLLGRGPKRLRACRRRPDGEPRRHRRCPIALAVPPMWPGTHKATSSSPMATRTREW